MNSLKYKFDQLKDNDLTGKESDDQNVYYETEGNARNVCFVLEDGRRFFINYAYLISGESNAENTSIILVFTTHKIILNGFNLLSIYIQFMTHSVRQIAQTNNRYSGLINSAEPILNEIDIIPT